MNDILNQSFWGNTYLQYIIAVGGILVALIIIRLLKKFVIRKIQKLVAGTDNQFDDMAFEAVEKFVLPFAYLLINYNIITQLTLHPKVASVLRVAIAVISVYYIVRIINHVLSASLKKYMERKLESPERIRQMGGVIIVLKAIVWFMGVVLLLDNLGYNVATILAGMGIGGIAIALAAQNILGDLFSYFVIFFDKPFEIGDFVNAEGKSGTVEYIGIRTTRIRSISGEEVVLSNTKLTGNALHNYKRMQRRRIAFSTGVTYQTSAEQLKKIPSIMEDAVRSQETLTFDRAHLASFGDFSINFETVYFVDSADYMVHMDAQQGVLQNIFEAFEKENIQFAYPTQTLFLENQNKEVPVEEPQLS